MKHLQPILEAVGFNHHESTIYLRLLESGERPASVIARESKFPRSTVRNALDKLCERGIVRKVYKRNTQHYSCRPPTTLVEHLRQEEKRAKERAEEMMRSLPAFEAIHGKRAIVPKVQVFEGKAQVIEAFNRSLYQEPLIQELLIFTSYDFLKDPVIRKNDDELFMKQRIKRGISARVLVGRTKESSRMVMSAPHELRERRFIPERHKLPGNIHVYGHSVMYFSASDGEYMAVLVESALMADTMRALFEFMWEQCS